MLVSLLKELDIPFEPDAPLGALTWYGVGGCAEVLAHPTNVEQLSALMKKCHDDQVPVHILGSGANLLIPDKGVRGVVIHLDAPAFKQLEINGNHVHAGAGYDLARLVLHTAKAGLGGLEILAGIPASVGGAVRMNAGGRFGEIGATVRRVQVMNQRGEVYERDRDDLVFGYRQTNITSPIITQVEFELTQDDPAMLMKQVKEIFLYKKNAQPLGEDSAGCAFKNPQLESHDDPRADNPYMHEAAGKLIDMAGLKKYRVGGACVSERHANFMITDHNATAADVLAVLEHVQKVVKERFDVQLQREIVVW